MCPQYLWVQEDVRAGSKQAAIVHAGARDTLMTSCDEAVFIMSTGWIAFGALQLHCR